MKKYFSTIFFLISLYHCSAQETTAKKNRLTESVTEHFYVLKNNKQVKEGEYQAIYRNKVVLARGAYTNNRKTGIWYFYNTREKVVQVYNYTQKRLLYEEPVDSASLKHIQYLFDRKFTDSDRVTKPIKIGGSCYGYLPYLTIFRLSDDYYLWENRYYAILELLISPGGRLADVKIHIKTDESDKVTTFSPDIFSEEDKQFIPATLNGHPIMSRIFVLCSITHDGNLDVD